MRRRVAAGGVALLLALAGPGAWAIAAAPRSNSPAGGQAASDASQSSGLPSLPGALGGGITSPEPTSTVSTPTVASTATADSGDGGISSTSAIGIAIAAFVIIAGIGIAIFRDARKRVPQPHAAVSERIPGSRRPPKARKLSAAEKRRRKRGRAPKRR